CGGMAALSQLRGRVVLQFPGGQERACLGYRGASVSIFQLYDKGAFLHPVALFHWKLDHHSGLLAAKLYFAGGFRAAIDDQLDQVGFRALAAHSYFRSPLCRFEAHRFLLQLRLRAVAQESAGEEPEDRSEADQEGDEERAVLAECHEKAPLPHLFGCPLVGDLFRSQEVGSQARPVVTQVVKTALVVGEAEAMEKGRARRGDRAAAVSHPGKPLLQFSNAGVDDGEQQRWGQQVAVKQGEEKVGAQAIRARWLAKRRDQALPPGLGQGEDLLRRPLALRNRFGGNGAFSGQQPQGGIDRPEARVLEECVRWLFEPLLDLVAACRSS